MNSLKEFSCCFHRWKIWFSSYIALVTGIKPENCFIQEKRKIYYIENEVFDLSYNKQEKMGNFFFFTYNIIIFSFIMLSNLLSTLILVSKNVENRMKSISSMTRLFSTISVLFSLNFFFFKFEVKYPETIRSFVWL